MSDIVDTGCYLLIWLGLLDASSCVRSPELQSPLWLKMIAGPTLVITVLVLVLFEDLYVRPAIRLPLDIKSTQPVPKLRRRYQTRRPGYFIKVESASEQQEPLLERDKIRLLICDKTADQNEVCYRLAKSCPLKELVQFHYRSFGRELEDDDVHQFILLRLGTKTDAADQPRISSVSSHQLKLDKSPRQLGLRDLDGLEIQLDYKLLYESYSNVLWRSKVHFSKELEHEKASSRDLTSQLKTTIAKLEQEQSEKAQLWKLIEEQKLEIHHLHEYRHAAKEAKANAARIEVLYALESSNRSRLEKELHNILDQLCEARFNTQQNQMEFEKELSSKAALMDQLKLELEAVNLDRDHLLQQNKLLKAEKDKAVKFTVIKTDELRNANKQLCEAQIWNEKIATEISDLRDSIRNLEASNSILQFQLHEYRKDGEIKPGALICRPRKAEKKVASNFESNAPASDWIRSTTRSLPGIHSPLLIIDDGLTHPEEPRPFNTLDSKTDWRCS